MEKEDLIICNRFKELAYQCDTRNYHTFTDFLNLNEINLFYTIHKELPNVRHSLWGGYPSAERCVLAFHNEQTIEQSEYQIQCIKIAPTNAKFSNTLTHRDFLGALINLGIERAVLGDILVQENVAYVFCLYSMTEYIITNLTKVKHTTVKCSLVTDDTVDITPSYKEINGTIASNRLDTILALAFHQSRSSISGLIAGGKVFVGGRLVLSNSYELKENDIVSVRGYGKFVFKGIHNVSKKGRLCATLLVYI